MRFEGAVTCPSLNSNPARLVSAAGELPSSREGDRNFVGRTLMSDSIYNTVLHAYLADKSVRATRAKIRFSLRSGACGRS